MLLSNPEIKKQVLGVFVSEVYKTLKNKEIRESNIDEDDTVINLNIHNHFDGTIDNLTINK